MPGGVGLAGAAPPGGTAGAILSLSIIAPSTGRLTTFITGPGATGQSTAPATTGRCTIALATVGPPITGLATTVQTTAGRTTDRVTAGAPGTAPAAIAAAGTIAAAGAIAVAEPVENR